MKCRPLSTLRNNEQGATLVEFALVTPLLLGVMAVIFELGAALHQSNLLEKQVMAGAMLAARGDYPLDNSDQARVTNFVRTGSVQGGSDLLEGWGQAGASLQIITQTYNLDGETVPYVQVSATVPYMPMMDDLLNFLGFNNFILNADHEEVFIP